MRLLFLNYQDHCLDQTWVSMLIVWNSRLEIKSTYCYIPPPGHGFLHHGSANKPRKKLWWICLKCALCFLAWTLPPLWLWHRIPLTLRKHYDLFEPMSECFFAIFWISLHFSFFGLYLSYHNFMNNPTLLKKYWSFLNNLFLYSIFEKITDKKPFAPILRSMCPFGFHFFWIHPTNALSIGQMPMNLHIKAWSFIYWMQLSFLFDFILYFRSLIAIVRHIHCIRFGQFTPTMEDCICFYVHNLAPKPIDGVLESRISIPCDHIL